MKKAIFNQCTMFRRGIAYMLSILFCIGGLSSCNDDYDDTELRNDLENLEERVASLEAWQKSVNTNIQSLQSLVAALENENAVTGVVPVIENNVEVGYKITFRTGDPIVIRHGKNGSTPLIGVAKDTDGNYYWTLDGQFLTDSETGNKIPVTGAKGDTGEKGDKGDPGEKGDAGETGAAAIAPQVRINSDSNEWEISTDGGTTWTPTGVKATGADGAKGDKGDDGAKGDRGDKGEKGEQGEKGDRGDAIFAENGVAVSDDGSSVTFTLADGTTTFTVPIVRTLTVGFESYETFEITPTTTNRIKIVLPSDLKETDYTALVAELKTAEGIDLAIATRAGQPIIEINKPTFGADGSYNDDAAVTINKPYDGIAILKITLIDNDGQELSASRPVNLRMKVSSADELAAALQNSGAVMLGGDLTLATVDLSAGQEVTVDLAGHTLNLNGKATSQITGGSTVIYKNGTIKSELKEPEYWDLRVSDGTVVLENVTFGSPSNGGLSAQGENARLTIRNSTVKGNYFAISSNAAPGENGKLKWGENATILLEDSHFEAVETALMNNVPANITIRNCTFKGNHQAAFLRGGTYDIENSTFTLNATLEASYGENHHTTNWEDGNRAAFAAITIGNRSSNAYQYPTKVTMKGVTATVEGTYSTAFPAMYVYANPTEGNGVAITYDNVDNFSSEYDPAIEYGSDNITVNGSAATKNQTVPTNE